MGDVEKDASGVDLEVYRSALRAAFVSRDGKWEAACSKNGETCRDDIDSIFHRLYVNYFGKLEDFETGGLAKRESCCHDIGWLSNQPSLYRRAERDRFSKFAGWRSSPAAKPKPLRTIPDAISDPEKWRTANLLKSELEHARLTLDKALRKQRVCPAVHSKPPAMRAKSIPSDWVRVKGAYRASSGKVIALITTSEQAVKGCGMEREDGLPGLIGDWVLVADRTKVSAMHVFEVGPEGGGPNLEFIEFGDFDADGKTEVVLFYSGYNRDGYVLLHSGMTRQVEFLWGYH
ncbi:MAG: hypothetical protein JNM76_04465 [Betaproteobacteria bacterium]|nr:hypothetical protein [Betaproteobacteria bacterium]